MIDACCCVGGNLIQFALLDNVKKVIGVELDPQRIECAQHNCTEVYQVPPDKVQFINKSISDVDCGQKLGVAGRDESVVFFFDPPWGGMNYYDKSTMTFEDFSPYPMKEALT